MDLIRRVMGALSRIFADERTRSFSSGGRFCSREEFWAAIWRECRLADRTGRDLCLLVINPVDSDSSPHCLRRLTEALKLRLRASDQCGWFEHDCIGVLLPHTGADGARTLAESIVQSIARWSPAIDVRLYAYPSQWPFEKSRDLRDFADGERMESEAPEISGRVSAAVLTASPGKYLLRDLGGLLAKPIPRWKRSVDILGAMAGLLLLSPVLLLTAMLIKVVSPGPILFTQTRIGHRGKPFKLLKFRTMHVNAGSESHRQLLTQLIGSERPMTKLDSSHDPRIIPFGRLLRVLGVDELPQLVNVLRGEMSLVGPRPCLPYELENYHLWHNRRFETVPGLTGLWQVSGKNRMSFAEMVRLDVRYARRLSLWMDLLIIARTIPAIAVQVSDYLHRPEN